MTASASHLITAGAVATSTSVLRPGWVKVAADRIVAVGPGTPDGTVDTALPDSALVPGFVDIHVHGGGGASFATDDQDEATAAVAFHRRHGTTTTLASLVSASPELMLRQVEALADLVDDRLLAGIHLEGPWLAPGKRGAHDPKALRHPEPAELTRLLALGRGTIAMVTLAPELPGGLDAVRQLTSAGVTVGIGHTDANYSQTKEAIEAGARVATHLFNAMPPLHHRNPGPALALLEDPRVVLELVGDGAHLDPALLRWVLAAAGPERVALITDAMSAAGMPPGHYRLGSLEVTVTDGTVRLPSGTIAGSTATTAQLFVTAYQARRGSPDPLLDASHLTASTPAAALGFTDIGTLERGQQANLVAVDQEMRPVAVMAQGEWTTPP